MSILSMSPLTANDAFERAVQALASASGRTTRAYVATPLCPLGKPGQETKAVLPFPETSEAAPDIRDRGGGSPPGKSLEGTPES